MQGINAASAGSRLPWLHKYTRAFAMGFQTALEYRVNFLISLISAAYPIFIQSFLWTAIYNASPHAEVYGFTYRQMIVYTFLAGLVARIVRTGFEYEIMEDVKMGRYSKFLVQPIGYFPFRLASYFGNKLPGQAMILGILALLLLGLSAFWGLSFTPGRILLFLLTLLLATALNFLIFYCFSAMAFWIVEVGFLFEGIRITTVLLSGGIFPLEVFGERAMRIFNLLPFKYTVYFPINVLNGKLSTAETLEGMLIQCLWIGGALALANVLWRAGGRRYVAVGG
jgi:ABC-2 type transport system permease protein